MHTIETRLSIDGVGTLLCQKVGLQGGQERRNRERRKEAMLHGEEMLVILISYEASIIEISEGLNVGCC